MANHNIQQTLSIDLAQQSYPIIIGDNIINLDNISPYITGRQILVVTNETIAPLHLHQLDFLKSDYECEQYILPDGEMYKSYEYWFAIQDFLIKHHFHRDCTIIAFGGGVVGDLTGFVAATYQRGVNLIQIPTTLLAQVDSSVGGKTAINHPIGKNMIGCFYQPSAVLIDLSTLLTLPSRELRAGLAEVVKYGLLSGDEFLTQIESLISEKDFLNSKLIVDIVARCCQIKASFVNQDEKEKGARALLNLGHTFAHAIEAYTNYQQFLHGEAVAIGLYCAAILSNICGYADRKLMVRIDQLLKCAQLPRRVQPDWSTQALLELMKQDKKVLNNRLRMIALSKEGQCFIDDTVTEDQIIQTLMLATEGVEK